MMRVSDWIREHSWRLAAAVGWPLGLAIAALLSGCPTVPIRGSGKLEIEAELPDELPDDEEDSSESP